MASQREQDPHGRALAQMIAAATQVAQDAGMVPTGLVSASLDWLGDQTMPWGQVEAQMTKATRTLLFMSVTLHRPDGTRQAHGSLLFRRAKPA